MSSIYESLMTSLNEEVDDIKKYGKLQGRKTVLEVCPVKVYSSGEIENNNQTAPQDEAKAQ